MSEPSAFRGVIDFFFNIGMYDVILPFLLVFAIVFAILDKSRIFGTMKIGEEKYPMKNINAVVAFVIAFFVVASAQLVEVLTTVSSHVVILLLASVLFLTLVGSFSKESDEGVFLEGGWKTGFMIVMLIGIILIFLNALNWLELGYNWLKDHWDNQAVSSAILLLFIALVVGVVTRTPTKDSNKKNNK
ncbi:hypothetical protein KY320_01605 [Candidatus Woesearchaeota archaeon]|nr:hypothetical protein [Candidatus Woesearchaeota archaeon]